MTTACSILSLLMDYSGFFGNMAPDYFSILC